MHKGHWAFFALESLGMLYAPQRQARPKEATLAKNTEPDLTHG